MHLKVSHIILSLFTIFVLCFYFYDEKSNQHIRSDLLQSIKYRSEKSQPTLPTIAHAGGSFKENYYTNSLQALQWNKDKYDYFELDFSKTSDGTYVCAHGWSRDQRAKALGDDQEGAPTLKQFLEIRKTHDWTACTLEEALNWAIKNNKKIITDVKDNNIEALQHAIKLDSKAKNTLIPQIYSLDEYNQVNAMNFDKIILTLYKTEINEVDLAKWLVNKNIYAITTWHHRAPYLAKIINDSGIPVYVHTVNDQVIAKYLREHYGIQGIYTDILDNFPFFDPP